MEPDAGFALAAFQLSQMLLATLVDSAILTPLTPQKARAALLNLANVNRSGGPETAAAKRLFEHMAAAYSD
jgi:hypothetical protein